MMLELISNHEINTQDELIAHLRSHGFEVTQATISRDIRELKIAKMTMGDGSYRYVAPKGSYEEGGTSFSTTLLASIVSVEHACNIVVIKTSAGLAQAVAVGIDGMKMYDVLGCVAGDDTIMIVCRNEKSAGQIAERIKLMMRDY